MRELVDADELFGLEGEQGLRVPAWQLHGRERLQGVPEVVAVWPHRLVSLSAWMLLPNPAMGGRTPRQALGDGDVDLVALVAEQRER